jgi:hypothetical protein
MFNLLGVGYASRLRASLLLDLGQKKKNENAQGNSLTDCSKMLSRS